MFEMKNIQGEEKDMTLLAYQVFLAVVEQESFQKAAQVLNLTPSAISHAVASMETELGSALFIRSKQGVYLTNYGKELFPYIKNVQNSEEYLQQAVAQIARMEKGEYITEGIATTFIKFSEIDKVFHLMDHPDESAKKMVILFD